MKITAEEQKFEKVHINEGIYHARFKEIKDVGEGQYGARVALIFAAYHTTEQPPVELATIAYKKLTPSSKLGEIATAIGAKLTPGQEVDFDTLIGTPCRVMVEDYEKDGKKVSGIEKVKPAAEESLAFISKVEELLKSETEVKEVG